MKQLLFILSLSIFFTQCKKNVASPDLGTEKVAPEISLNDLKGTTRTLSSLKGKVVILQFWASWCHYCREENPQIVALYNKYNKQGLEIYSVSLDTDKAAWEKGIKEDGLVWENHVSDLKKWNSAPAVTYGINSTPALLLLDKEGIVRVLNFTPSMTAEIEKYLK